MADRHGKVSKWVTETRYTVQALTLDGMKEESRLDRDGLKLAELEALERQRLHAKNEIFAGLTVVTRERVLYGMTKERFFEVASELVREPALDI